MALNPEKEKFESLRKLALKLGASDAKVMPATNVVVEDRVVLKCKVGCSSYGKTLACPPYTPTAAEFRKIVGEYSTVMFMKFTSHAEADGDLQKSLGKSQADAPLPADLKAKADLFWRRWKDDKKKMLEAVVELEKEAMRNGFSLAIAFVSGACQLCEKCSVDTGICVHPEMARYSEDAVGVNVKKTAKNAGIKVTFPFEKNPESFALLLID